MRPPEYQLLPLNDNIQDEDGDARDVLAPVPLPWRQRIPLWLAPTAGVVAMLVLLVIMSNSLNYPKSHICDPHALPGRVNYSQHPAHTVWVLNNSIDTANCPSLSLAQKLIDQQDSIPDAIPGGHLFLLLIGNSVDRNNMVRTCQFLGAGVYVIPSNHPLFPIKNLSAIAPPYWRPGHTYEFWWPRVCRFSRVVGQKTLNITMMNLFTWGTDDWDQFAKKRIEWYPPNTIEDRVDLISLPLMKSFNLSTPTFVQVSATVWDLTGIADDNLSLARKMMQNGTRLEELPDRNQLAAPRFTAVERRLSKILSHLTNSAFPKLSRDRVYVSSMHLGKDEENGWLIDEKGNLRGDTMCPDSVSALNSAHLHAMQQANPWYTAMGIGAKYQRDPWGSMISQDKELPFLHRWDPHPDGRATFLWLEMWLHRWVNLKSSE